MNTGRVIVMRQEHIPAVIRTHLASFPEFFLSSLGPRFLSLYYSGICSAAEGISFVCLSESGEPAAFVAGSANPRGFYSRLLKRDWVMFAFASLGAVLKNPSAMRRVARAVLHPSGNPVGLEVAGLFSIGVHPELQGIGAGKHLVHAFLEEARRRGCRRVFLTTDRDDNEPVNAFYRKLGFAVERQYQTPEGRRMNEYWISLD